MSEPKLKLIKGLGCSGCYYYKTINEDKCFTAKCEPEHIFVEEKQSKKLAEAEKINSMNECKFCDLSKYQGDREIKNISGHFTINVDRDKDLLIDYDYSNHNSSCCIQIKFCPMCGRKL